MEHFINQPFGALNLNDPQSVRHIIREFCSTHDPDSIYLALWDMLKQALCSTEATNWDERKRADYIFIYETLLQLVSATYALTEEWKKSQINDY
jgi:hypothetical protein